MGESVFTQVAGVHADGDNKSNLYCNALLPERFGRHREYALGKNSGRANILKNLETYGLELTPQRRARRRRKAESVFRQSRAAETAVGIPFVRIQKQKTFDRVFGKRAKQNA